MLRGTVGGKGSKKREKWLHLPNKSSLTKMIDGFEHGVVAFAL